MRLPSLHVPLYLEQDDLDRVHRVHGIPIAQRDVDTGIAGGVRT